MVIFFLQHLHIDHIPNAVVAMQTGKYYLNFHCILKFGNSKIVLSNTHTLYGVHILAVHATIMYVQKQSHRLSKNSLLLDLPIV